MGKSQAWYISKCWLDQQNQTELVLLNVNHTRPQWSVLNTAILGLRVVVRTYMCRKLLPSENVTNIYSWWWQKDWQNIKKMDTMNSCIVVKWKQILLNISI